MRMVRCSTINALLCKAQGHTWQPLAHHFSLGLVGKRSPSVIVKCAGKESCEPFVRFDVNTWVILSVPGQLKYMVVMDFKGIFSWLPSMDSGGQLGPPSVVKGVESVMCLSWLISAQISLSCCSLPQTNLAAWPGHTRRPTSSMWLRKSVPRPSPSLSQKDLC